MDTTVISSSFDLKCLEINWRSILYSSATRLVSGTEGTQWVGGDGGSGAVPSGMWWSWLQPRQRHSQNLWNRHPLHYLWRGEHCHDAADCQVRVMLPFASLSKMWSLQRVPHRALQPVLNSLRTATRFFWLCWASLQDQYRNFIVRLMQSKSSFQRWWLVCFCSNTLFLMICNSLLYSLCTHTIWKGSVENLQKLWDIE